MGKEIIERDLRPELQEPPLIRQSPKNSCPATFVKSDRHSDSDPFRGSEQNLPGLIRQSVLLSRQQEDLDQSPGFFPADQARRKNAGIIDDFTCLPVNHHHPGAIADRRRFLGNQLFRQIICEFFQPHLKIEPHPRANCGT